uniref:peptidylprolyl isomerase n=1 Tax=Chromera velia CCMP2878 TaxID=1169474 RepID=A0A0G4GAT3_9ALVE|eukprot:Cvel_20957.t1-p1 / transcript=Cvel_20957.t1 / gene=Cvel_20957 / organism=Chromera_velia_CCMP2878 / gene_product=Peptidyl-prolyl cis-trans isomerase, putative / transcript_product=Peptidyl-prolyl cis-trans isomerase, putative / location=Cvel_scaffold1926:16311-22217(+) / protein_length=750 / sequence_SO=supercontig / SO=protein_coding / is_pseudo=false
MRFGVRLLVVFSLAQLFIRQESAAALSAVEANIEGLSSSSVQSSSSSSPSKCEDNRDFRDSQGDDCAAYAAEASTWCASALLYVNAGGLDASTECCACKQAVQPGSNSGGDGGSLSSESPGACVSDSAFRDAHGDGCSSYEMSPSFCLQAAALANESGESAATKCCVCRLRVRTLELLDPEGRCTDDLEFRDSQDDSCEGYTANPEWCTTASAYRNAEMQDASVACCVCLQSHLREASPFSQKRAEPEGLDIGTETAQTTTLQLEEKGEPLAENSEPADVDEAESTNSASSSSPSGQREGQTEVGGSLPSSSSLRGTGGGGGGGAVSDSESSSDSNSGSVLAFLNSLTALPPSSEDAEAPPPSLLSSLIMGEDTKMPPSEEAEAERERGTPSPSEGVSTQVEGREEEDPPLSTADTTTTEHSSSSESESDATPTPTEETGEIQTLQETEGNRGGEERETRLQTLFGDKEEEEGEEREDEEQEEEEEEQEEEEERGGLKFGAFGQRLRDRRGEESPDTEEEEEEEDGGFFTRLRKAFRGEETETSADENENEKDATMGVPPPTEEAFVDGSTGSSEVPSRVYFDVSIDGEETGRLVFKLFSDVLPRTTRNFGELCRGTTPNPEDPTKTLAYEGSGFHRIIPDFMAQGGDFTNHDGTGGLSIFGPRFEDEGFPVKHTKRGMLSMANAGPDTNGSQFFITFVPLAYLDGKHVVFGEVEEGWEVLEALERLGTRGGRPKKTAEITTAGVLASST